MTNLYSADNPAFAGFAFYSGLLIMKMIAMSFLTAAQRYKKKVFVNAEDLAVAGVAAKLDADDDVERIRRAHLNDLENIPAFLITGLIFIASDPNVIFALMMFRLYTLARFGHTIVYAVFVVRQPARFICFFTGVLVNFILIFAILVSFPQL